MDSEEFQSCIETCIECTTQCDISASECLKESEVNMLTKCIRLDKECSEMCFSTASMMKIRSEHSGGLCGICVDYCTRCAEECEKHAHIAHCKKCGETCRKCAEECRKMTLQLAH